jgi:hypothetical protein
MLEEVISCLSTYCAGLMQERELFASLNGESRGGDTAEVSCPVGVHLQASSLL